jgi:L-rhamnose 1-dehydrogenase
MKVQTPQGGSIIGISSISALVGGEMQWYELLLDPDFTILLICVQSHYTPTKAGILSLMQSCAVALGKYGIRANAILPGTVETDINKEDLSDVAKREAMVKRTALGRLGGVCCVFLCELCSLIEISAPNDIAGPVVFLASDLAKYVTGASLLVDGGLFVNLQ